MKAIFVFVVFVLQLAVGRASALEVGGTTAGGGGVVNPAKLSMNSAKAATIASKSIIMNYLWSGTQNKDWSRNCENLDTPADKTWCLTNRKLFFSDPDVFAVIKNLTIDFRENAPCLDALGNPVDGSIFGVPDGHICISGLNLTQKLDDFFYEPQIAALVLHELSHLLGTTEEEATALQLRLISYLQETSIHDLRATTDQIIYGASSAFSGTIDFAKSCNPEDPEKCMMALCSADAYEGYGARLIMNIWNIGHFKMIPDELRAETLRNMYRQVALSDYLCSRAVSEAVAQGKTEVIETNKTVADRALQRYSNIKGRGELDLVDYIDKTNPTGITSIAFHLAIPDRLKSISDADFPGLLVDMTNEAKSLEEQYQSVLKAEFNLVEQ